VALVRLYKSQRRLSYAVRVVFLAVLLLIITITGAVIHQ
jgi:hypothetical protein